MIFVLEIELVAEDKYSAACQFDSGSVWKMAEKDLGTIMGCASKAIMDYVTDNQEVTIDAQCEVLPEGAENV